MSGPFSFPVFLDVRGRRCLVAGGGQEARHKAETLAGLGAHVVVSDPEHVATHVLAGRSGVEIHRGPFERVLLVGTFLVISASDDRTERRRIGLLAREAGVLVNALDENDLCDWAAPAILRRGGLTIALGTGGIAPALAVRLRDRLADEIGDEYGELLELFGDVRPRIMASGRPFAARRRLWYELVDGPALGALRDGQADAARMEVTAAVEAWEAEA